MKIAFCLTLLFFIHIALFAQPNISQSLSRLNANESDSDRMNTYNDIFSHYMYSKSDSAIYYAQSGLQYFTQKKNKLGQAQMTNLLATIDEMQGRLEMAKKKYVGALQLYTETGYKKGIAKTKNNIGVIEARSGNTQVAVKDFIEALKLSEEAHDTDNIVQAYIKLGVVNEQMNNLDKSLEYYNDAAGIQKYRSVESTTLALYNNIGIIYGKRGDYPRALANFQESIEKSNKPAFTELRILSYMNAGIAYAHLGNKASAMSAFDTALKTATEQHMPEAHARTLINLANAVFQTDPQKALTIMHQALDEAKAIGQREMQTDIYASLVDAYAELKDYKNAFYTLQQAQALTDSLSNLQKDKEIANLQSVYELDKSKEEVQTLNIVSRKSAREKEILLAVALIIVVILIILIFYYRKTVKLNAQLVKQQESLRNSNSVKDKLFSIIGHDLRGPIANIPVMLQLYSDDEISSEEKEYILTQLKNHVRASTETLDKLLYWGQSQIKGITLQQVVFETKAHITTSLQLLKSAADQKQITLFDNTPADLKIYADPSQFDFVIRNLLSNALKFTHKNGAIEVDADINKLQGFIVYTVKDNGIGIERQFQKDIFEPFSNSKEGTANETGTSIGLMLCREFVITNGGKIWVESESGSGTTFYFSLKTA